MYAILNVIYGYALDGKLSAALEEALENGEGGFESPYSGGGDGFPYFGIDLDTFDEVEFYKVSDLKLTPTPAQVKEFNDLWDALSKTLQDDIIKASKGKKPVPDVWIAPSSS